MRKKPLADSPESFTLLVQDKNRNEKQINIEELSTAIKNETLTPMTPVRWEHEKRSRVLKFHPVREYVGRHIDTGAVRKEHQKLSTKGRVIKWTLIAMATAVLLVLIASVFFPHIRREAGFLIGLGTGNPLPEKITSLVIEGNLEETRAALLSIQERPLIPLPSRTLDTAIHLALVELESNDREAARQHLPWRSISALSRSENARFLPLFKEVLTDLNEQNLARLSEFTETHTHYYPAVRVNLWALEKSASTAVNEKKIRELLVIAFEQFGANRFYRIYADNCMEKQRYREAVNAYVLLTHDYSDDADLFFNLGQANLALNNRKQAMAYFKKALAINPDLPIYFGQ